MTRTLLLSLFLTCAHAAVANHILGGYMRYQHTGNNNYQIELTVFRDCAGGGASFDAPAFISIYQGDSLYADLYFEYDFFEPVAIDQVCVQFPAAFCVEKAVYSFDYSFPDDNFTYTIAYQRCCRSLVINNLVYPGDQGWTMSIELTPAARALHNSSPILAEPLRFLACQYQTDTLPFFSHDADGDVLTYSLCSPLKGGGPILTPPGVYSCDGAQPDPACPPPYDNAVFGEPLFSFEQPLGASSTSSMDLVNGNFVVTPYYWGGFSYGVCVKEYRNGFELSATRYDLTLIVMADPMAAGEPEHVGNLRCTPNPAGAFVRIEAPDFDGEPCALLVFDALGKVLARQVWQAAPPVFELYTGHFPQGIFTVKIGSVKKSATGRFLR